MKTQDKTEPAPWTCCGQPARVTHTVRKPDADPPMVLRRHQCLHCGRRWPTYEYAAKMPERPSLWKPKSITEIKEATHSRSPEEIRDLIMLLTARTDAEGLLGILDYIARLLPGEIRKRVDWALGRGPAAKRRKDLMEVIAQDRQRGGYKSSGARHTKDYAGATPAGVHAEDGANKVSYEDRTYGSTGAWNGVR